MLPETFSGKDRWEKYRTRIASLEGQVSVVALGAWQGQDGKPMLYVEFSNGTLDLHERENAFWKEVHQNLIDTRRLRLSNFCKCSKCRR